jgi:pimeloyl-ACP methyl ester carboxylesterase
MARSLNDPPDRMIDLGHSQLPYWRIGHGPDVVFVHGWPLHAGTWRAVVAELAPDHCCHLIDLPGAGQSQWSAQTPRGIGGLAEVLAQRSLFT